VDDPVLAVDPTFITLGEIWPYNKSFAIYKCPSDRSNVNGVPKVRSMSLSCWMNASTDISGENAISTIYRIYRRLGGIDQPSHRFTFLDEAPITLNDGFFFQWCDTPKWVDRPAAYHNQGGDFAFADGHMEMHHWRDPTTATGPPDGDASKSPDYAWLKERATSPR
jgi:prepilin-type processing-associated H-X9-DG protein